MTPAADVTESPSIAGAIRPTAVGRIAACLAAILIIATASTACTSSRSTAIPKQLSTAIDQMQTDETYSFDASMTTASSSITVDGTFTAPNTVVQTVRVPGRAAVEMRLVGNEVSIKDPVSGAFTATSAPQPVAFDLRSAFGALRSARSVSTSGTTYSFSLDPDATRTLAGADATGSATVAATTGATGLDRLEYRVTVGGRPVEVVIDYRRS